MAQQHSSGGRSPTDVAHYLSGIDFPATRADLVRHARNHDAEGEVLDLLDHMPNRDYGSMADVMKGVGQAK
jgi:hypothetical protein